MQTVSSLTFHGKRCLVLPPLPPLSHPRPSHHRFQREWKLFRIFLPLLRRHIYAWMTIFLHSCSKTISHTCNSCGCILLVFPPVSCNAGTFCSCSCSSSLQWFFCPHKNLHALSFGSSSRISSCIPCTDPQCCCALWRWWLLSHKFHQDKEPNLHCFQRSSETWLLGIFASS